MVSVSVLEKRRLSKLIEPMLMFVDVRAGPDARHLVLLQLAGALGCTGKQAQGYLDPCKYCGELSSKPKGRSFLDQNMLVRLAARISLQVSSANILSL